MKARIWPGLHGSRGDAQASSAGEFTRLLTMRT